MAWPFPLGFDTNAYYLPEMLQGIPNLITVFRTAQLNLLILSSLYKLYPHPFVILNVVGIALQSGLGISLYFYCTKVVKLTPSQSFVSCLAFITNVLTFRLTWDQYRMSLGLIFALLTWATLSSKSQRVKLFSIPLVVLMISSNFLPALLFLCSMITYLAINGLKALKLMFELLVTIIGSWLFTLQNFVPSNEGSVQARSLLSYGTNSIFPVAITGFAFFVFTSWMLIPFSILAARKALNKIHGIWFCVVFGIALLGPFIRLLTVYCIWIYWMIPFPLAIFLGLFFANNDRMKLITCVFLTLGLVLTTTYIISSPVSPSPYYRLNLWPVTGIPTGYLQSTVPISQESQLLILLNDSIFSVSPNSIIFLPAQFYGFALLQANPHHVILEDIGEIDSLDGNTSFEQVQNLTHLTGSYTIWFSHANGWYGVDSLPSNFRICLTEGEFSLFQIEIMSADYSNVSSCQT